MLPDLWGSDYDYAARMGHEFAPDLPRDHFCAHGYARDTCGRCHGPLAADDTSLLARVRRSTDQMTARRARIVGGALYVQASQK